jgi:hypothetical protein
MAKSSSGKSAGKALVRAASTVSRRQRTPTAAGAVLQAPGGGVSRRQFKRTVRDRDRDLVIDV